ncbi:MAG TPA: MarR family transcriptional regulator [Lysobacter sp.]
MERDRRQREQAAAGLEQLASLVRAQSWRSDGTPSLPPTQGAVLRMLSGQTEGLRARQIAQRLGITPASVSDSLKALEIRGWIARTVDAEDRRAATIRLTRQGRAVAGKLAHPARGMAALLQDLDEADTAALLRATQLLVARAQQQGLATGLRTCLGCRFFQPFASGDAARPHVCGFLGTPFGDAELRMDCADQSPADDTLMAANRERFRLKSPP